MAVFLDPRLEQIGDRDRVALFQPGIDRIPRQLRLMNRLRIIGMTEIQPEIGRAMNQKGLRALKHAINIHSISPTPRTEVPGSQAEVSTRPNQDTSGYLGNIPHRAQPWKGFGVLARGFNPGIYPNCCSSS